MPVSRTGTFERSISTPLPARPAISKDDDVSPAAPMSWMPTTASVWKSSRHASSRSFSVNGIADLHGRALLLRLVAGELLGRHRRAVDAVAAGLRADVEDRIADALGAAAEDPVAARRCPTFMTLTRMLPSYAGWNVVSPPTVGMPMQLP